MSALMYHGGVTADEVLMFITVAKLGEIALSAKTI